MYNLFVFIEVHSLSLFKQSFDYFRLILPYKMNSDCRQYLQNHIKVMLEKQPTTTSKEMKSLLMSGEQKFDLTLVNPSTLHKFINRNMDRFKTMGTRAWWKFNLGTYNYNSSENQCFYIYIIQKWGQNWIKMSFGYQHFHPKIHPTPLKAKKWKF